MNAAQIGGAWGRHGRDEQGRAMLGKKRRKNTWKN